MKILEALAAIAIAGMILFIFLPRAKDILEQSRKAKKDWRGFLAPLAVVVVFVVLLVLLASG